ncbi:MAG: hypothetical protein AAF747_02420 [Planctomycetota bacterium]
MISVRYIDRPPAPAFALPLDSDEPTLGDSSTTRVFDPATLAAFEVTPRAVPESISTPFVPARQPDPAEDVVIIDRSVFGEETVETDEEAPTTTAELTSIMAGSRPIAIIDGTAVRLGDIVDGRWLVAEIDGESQTCTLVLATDVDVRQLLTLRRD